MFLEDSTGKCFEKFALCEGLMVDSMYRFIIFSMYLVARNPTETCCNCVLNVRKIDFISSTRCQIHSPKLSHNFSDDTK
jgi:hypothetical protein